MRPGGLRPPRLPGAVGGGGPRRRLRCAPPRVRGRPHVLEARRPRRRGRSCERVGGDPPVR
eukprot:919871-Lingulodinium_polyedra.AAC.1